MGKILSKGSHCIKQVLVLFGFVLVFLFFVVVVVFSVPKLVTQLMKTWKIFRNGEIRFSTFIQLTSNVSFLYFWIVINICAAGHTLGLPDFGVLNYTVVSSLTGYNFCYRMFFVCEIFQFTTIILPNVKALYIKEVWNLFVRKWCLDLTCLHNLYF